MKKIWLAVFVFCAGCSSPESKKTPEIATAAYQSLYDQAVLDVSHNQYKAAAKKFEKIIIEQPRTELAIQSEIQIGDIFFNQSRWAEASRFYIKAIDLHLITPLVAVAGLKAAQCLTNLDRHKDALDRLDVALKVEGISQPTQLQALRLRIQLLKHMNAPLEEVKTLLYLASLETVAAKQEEYHLQAQGVVESALSVPQLQEVAADSKYGALQLPAKFKLGQYYFERSEFSKAREQLAGVVSKGAGTGLSEQSQELLKQIGSRERVNPHRIGAILPLTGKLSRVGYKTLRGLQLGLGVFGPNKGNIDLAVIDSGGNPSTARRGVERLVVEDNAIAIVGSLSSREATAIAAKSQEVGVPNISLSQKAGLTEIGDFIFRNSLTSAMQVQQLVSDAITNRHLKRFAILYPNDLYGTEYANLFWDEVIKQGGEIRGAESYKPGETDFNQPIKKLVGTNDAEARRWEYKLRLDEWKKNRSTYSQKGLPQDLLPPIVDFDALFVPDSAKALGQIAPTLAYNDVKDLTLLGTNLWDTPATIERAGKFLKDALFIDSFLPSDPGFQNSTFYRDYQQTFGEAPEEFELTAYDAGLLLRKVLESGASTRPDLQQQLAHLSNLQGGYGPLTISDKREVVRPTVLLTVKDKQIVRAN